MALLAHWLGRERCLLVPGKRQAVGVSGAGYGFNGPFCHAGGVRAQYTC